MRETFTAELEQINGDLVELAQLVSVSMGAASQALREANIEQAEEVIAGDARIDFLQRALDEKAIQILALQGPVARDLRTLIGALRMTASLERMGDLTRHIGQLTRLRYPQHAIPDILRDDFEEFARLDQQIAEDTRELISTRDLTLVARIAANKSQVSGIHAGIFKKIASPAWTEPAPRAVDASLASRYYERFADHGVSVARKVSYLVTGQWERHDSLRA